LDICKEFGSSGAIYATLALLILELILGRQNRLRAKSTLEALFLLFVWVLWVIVVLTTRAFRRKDGS
jgi:hypothetical protein